MTRGTSLEQPVINLIASLRDAWVEAQAKGQALGSLQFDLDAITAKADITSEQLENCRAVITKATVRIDELVQNNTRLSDRIAHLAEEKALAHAAMVKAKNECERARIGQESAAQERDSVRARYSKCEECQSTVHEIRAVCRKCWADLSYAWKTECAVHTALDRENAALKAKVEDAERSKNGAERRLNERTMGGLLEGDDDRA